MVAILVSKNLILDVILSSSNLRTPKSSGSNFYPIVFSIVVVNPSPFLITGTCQVLGEWICIGVLICPGGDDHVGKVVTLHNRRYHLLS